MIGICLLRCKKLKSKERNLLNLAAELPPILLKVVFFELASEILDAKLETDMTKKKS